MKKFGILFLLASNLLASNYKLVPLSSHGIALAGANLAKSFNADAVFINPANMSFFNNSQLYFSANYYHIKGPEFINQNKNNNYDFYAKNNAKGKSYTVALPTFAYLYKLSDDTSLGFAAYTDFAGLYGWNDDFAKSLTKNMDIRGGTAALSFATKITPELSFGASVSANYSKLEFVLEKDNAKSINYFHPTKDTYWAYSGKIDTKSDINYGYKLALTYAPKYFDEKLRFSAVYNSEYLSKFYGSLDFGISKFEMIDFYFKASGIGGNEAAMFIDNILQEYGDYAFYDEYFNNLFGFNTTVAAVLLDVYNFDSSGGILNSLSSQDDKINFSGDFRTEFLYPASINLGIAYELGKHEFMLNIGRTFWDKFKKLKVGIDAPQIPEKTVQLIQATAQLCLENGCANSGALQEIIKQAMQMINFSDTDKEQMQEYMLAALLDDSLEQNWKNTTLLSIGYRYNYDKNWSFMAGFATEDSPIRREEISFLAKDSRMYMYSLGAEYRYNKNLIFNLSGMYQKYADVKTNNLNHVTSNFLPTVGEFKKQSNQIINLGISYSF